MKLIRLIIRRDSPSVSLAPAGLAVMTLFLGLAGYMFASQIVQSQQATLRYTFRTLGFLGVFLAPLITMRLLAEELNTGTFEILATTPLRDRDIVLGKFLTGWKVFFMWTLPVGAYLAVLALFGSPDWGAAFTGYVGLQAMAAMLIALGLFFSSLTASQILAAMGAILTGMAFSMADMAARNTHGAMRTALRFLDMQAHFGTFRRGVLDTRALLFFAATTVMLLFLTIRSVESRRWKFGAAPDTRAPAWQRRGLSIGLLVVSALLILDLVIVRASGRLWTTWRWIEALLALALAVAPGLINRDRLRRYLARRGFAVVGTVILNTALVLGLWALVLFLGARYYRRIDLTADKRHALSEQTVNLLRDVNRPIEIIVIQDEPEDLFQQIDDLLDAYAAHSSRIILKRIDPMRQPAEVEDLQRRFKLPARPQSEVLVVDGDTLRRIPARAMFSIPIYERSGQMRMATPRFDGEAELTGVLLNLLHDTPGTVVFLSGHGERNPGETEAQGYSTVAGRLRQNGWTVARSVISPGVLAQFPENAKVAIVAAPLRPLSDENLAALQAFLNRGGGVFLLLEPHVETGLAPLLEPWNIRLGADIVVDLSDYSGDADPTSLYVSRFDDSSAIGKAMTGLAAVMPGARRIAVANAGRRADVMVNNFMHTSGNGWAIKARPRDRLRVNPSRDRRGPISLGAMCERYQERREPGAPPIRGRMVVLGDSDFASNRYVDMVGNMDLFLNSIDWLAGRQDVLGARPREAGLRPLTMTRGQTQGLFWFSVVIIPMGALCVGLLAARRRRRLA